MNLYYCMETENTFECVKCGRRFTLYDEAEVQEGCPHCTGKVRAWHEGEALFGGVL